MATRRFRRSYRSVHALIASSLSVKGGPECRGGTGRVDTVEQSSGDDTPRADPNLRATWQARHVPVETQVLSLVLVRRHGARRLRTSATGLSHRRAGSPYGGKRATSCHVAGPGPAGNRCDSAGRTGGSGATANEGEPITGGCVSGPPAPD